MHRFTSLALGLLVSAGACTSAPTAGTPDGSVPPLPPGPVVDAGPDATALDPPAGCTDAPPSMKLTSVASGLDRPLYVTTAPGETGRLYIVEQTGRVRLVKDGVLADAPFIDVTSRLVAGGEQGLLGIAFHPRYADNGRFWLHYSGAGDGRTEIAEFRRSAASNDVAEPQPVKVLLTVAQPYANHNGGEIAFGPDGFLYVGLGDGGSGDDPLDHGQRMESQLGKILRLDVDRYPEPPPGNATGANVDPQIWDWGLRNPWRFSFDRKNGDLYIADVGQNAWEEIDWEPAGTGKHNYGWKIMEGAVCRPRGPAACVTEGLRTPVAVHGRAEAISITGGYVYRGAAIPCLRGRYVYGDFGTGRIFSFVLRDGVATAKAELTSDINPGALLTLAISSFGQDDAGELYLASFPGGRVYRFEPR